MHLHAYTMVYKCTHDATALSLCQSVVVKDLDFMGGPTSTSIRVETWKLCCLAMKTQLCLLFLKWESSVGKLCGPIMANDEEYILQCRHCSLLSKPWRDSSCVKLGRGRLPWRSAFPPGNLQDLQKAQLSLPTMGCMSAKSPGIGKRVPVFTTTTTITIDTGQQHTTNRAKNRCDPLRLGSKNQSYQYSCTKAKATR